MKVCVVGSGGREHALALHLARTAEVVVTPGNAGMEWTSIGGSALEVTDLGTDPGVAAAERFQRRRTRLPLYTEHPLPMAAEASDCRKAGTSPALAGARCAPPVLTENR